MVINKSAIFILCIALTPYTLYGMKLDTKHSPRKTDMLLAQAQLAGLHPVMQIANLRNPTDAFSHNNFARFAQLPPDIQRSIAKTYILPAAQKEHQAFRTELCASALTMKKRNLQRSNKYCIPFQYEDLTPQRLEAMEHSLLPFYRSHAHASKDRKKFIAYADTSAAVYDADGKVLQPSRLDYPKSSAFNLDLMPDGSLLWNRYEKTHFLPDDPEQLKFAQKIYELALARKPGSTHQVVLRGKDEEIYDSFDYYQKNAMLHNFPWLTTQNRVRQEENYQKRLQLGSLTDITVASAGTLAGYGCWKAAGWMDPKGDYGHPASGLRTLSLVLSGLSLPILYSATKNYLANALKKNS